MADITITDDMLNKGAEFRPVTASGHLPYVRIAGVLVFAYVSDGVLRVSVDLDESELGEGPDELTPMRVSDELGTLEEWLTANGLMRKG